MSIIKARIPEELVQELMRRFPPKCIQPGDDINKAYAYGGAVMLVQFIVQSYMEQNNINGPVANLPPPQEKGE